MLSFRHWSDSPVTHNRPLRAHPFIFFFRSAPPHPPRNGARGPHTMLADRMCDTLNPLGVLCSVSRVFCNCDTACDTPASISSTFDAMTDLLLDVNKRVIWLSPGLLIYNNIRILE